MIISSRARSVFPGLSIISFLASAYFSWILSSKAVELSPLHMTLIVTAISSFNIAIFFGWIGFGVMGGTIMTACAFLFVFLLDFRMSHHSYNLFTPVFLITASAGYLFASSAKRLDQLYLLKSEKTGEDINILTNDVMETNKGIKAFEEKLMRYSVLKQVAESLSAVLAMDDITTLIIEKTLKTLGKSGRTLLFLVDPDRQELMLSASNSGSSASTKMKKGDAFDRWVLRHRKPLMIDDVIKDFRFSSEGIEGSSDLFRSLIAAPLVSEGKVIGILRMDSPREFAYAQDDLRLLDIIANLGAVAIQNSLLYSRTQELAIRDGLTGLKVRRFFMESLHREVRRAARKKEQISLLLLDIDHFKNYNDRYGHASGDLILKFIAKTINEQLKEPDVAGRYGGEEIAMLLWRKDKREAVLKADRIRQLIKESPLLLRTEAANVTVSIGVSTYPEDAVTEEDLIRVADLRLYNAKAEGRDRVCSG